MRPRRLAGVVARPLNFTVSRAAFMAVVLVLVVGALALAVYLSTTRGGFGSALKFCLLIPAAAIFVCLAILLSRMLPPRSNWVLVIAPVVVVMSVVELIAFTTAIVRLTRTRDLRTRRNALITAVGGLSLIPGVGTYLMVMLQG